MVVFFSAFSQVLILNNLPDFQGLKGEYPSRKPFGSAKIFSARGVEIPGCANFPRTRPAREKAATFGSAQASLEAQGKEPAGLSTTLLPGKYSSQGTKGSQEGFIGRAKLIFRLTNPYLRINYKLPEPTTAG